VRVIIVGGFCFARIIHLLVNSLCEVISSCVEKKEAYSIMF
jgi:hypothetical protein